MKINHLFDNFLDCDRIAKNSLLKSKKRHATMNNSLTYDIGESDAYNSNGHPGKQGWGRGTA